MPLLVIYNPGAGDRTALPFIKAHVLPILSEHGKSVDKLVGTTAGRVPAQYCLIFYNVVTVVLASGDGTLQEIINRLASTKLPEDTTARTIQFAIVPCGTANALYYSLFPPATSDEGITFKLKSVNAFIHATKTIPLTLANVTSTSSDMRAGPPTSDSAIASVVASTSLHAAILHDSEALRAEIPGLERFKIAAEKNMKEWTNATVRLYPIPALGRVQEYDAGTAKFINHPGSEAGDFSMALMGPFAYFLTTVNVDRLEPTFRITPLARSIPAPEGSCDVVVLRPLRDPNIIQDTPQDRLGFAKKLWDVMHGAYANGSHLNLRYDVHSLAPNGLGPFAVEYFRCGGWEWIPDQNDKAAHLLCVDGAISTIEQGGRATLSVGLADRTLSFRVFG
ncbi:ATP-NAD kinase-like domain-containing protein [Infundibulicybe gibba]|nr:ATP-NAD kinase-like domain-containing protein [Infundibulicybe gibba]